MIHGQREFPLRFEWGPQGIEHLAPIDESESLVSRFGVRLGEQRSRVSARSRLGEKLTYIANQWPGLLVFLHDGRIEIDSNAVENLMRPVKLTAKNALFAGHDEGAAA